MTSSELMAAEREIARRHLGHFPWGSLVWAVANISVWFALWPFTFAGILPLWATLLIASVNVALCYLPSHEAQHDIFARPGQPLRWLNEAVGHISAVPLAIPFPMLRATHLEHHKHANDPARDPDISTHAETALGAIWASVIGRRPRDGQQDAYRATAERLGREDLLVQSALAQIAFYGVLFAGAMTGHALEVAVLWWLPRHIGLTWIHFYLSWAPHNVPRSATSGPGLARGRYRDTRSFRSVWGTVGSAGMEAHIVHHLHPRIPLFRTVRAYREMRPLLEARGCRLDDEASWN